DVQRQSSFSGRLRTEYLDNAAPRDAADSHRDIQRQRTGGYDGHFNVGAFPEAHDSALSAHAFYLRNRRIDSSKPVVVKSHKSGLLISIEKSDCADRKPISTP